MLTFIAEYPNEKNIRDGMMLRIKEIDGRYANKNRCYLDISLFRKRNNKITTVSSRLTIYHLNFLLDFFKIYKLLANAEEVYVQTIFNYAKVLVFLNVFFKKKPVTLDLHGVIPEELFYQGGKFQSKFYGFIEKLAFKRANFFIHVTNSMRLHFSGKYPNTKRSNFKDVILGIFTSIKSEIDYPSLEIVKKELDWDSSQVWIIYSGGTQQWQNVPLMLELVKNNQSPNYRYLFLTGHYERMTSLVSETNLQDKVKVLSVSPENLRYYYTIAHYGFILRDSTLVNRVSNPTKLSEYLAYGIIPIVLEPTIGDYNEMGYEFIAISEFSGNLKSIKSIRNQQIFNQYIDSMNRVLLPYL